MNIAILAAGAGDMICGSCLRDSAMAVALKRLGHQVSLIPLYTPLRTDSDDAGACEVFYGGVNVYLQHAAALFRHTPRFFDWILDRPKFLRAAGNWGAQTLPDNVAGLTASIIQGEDGKGRKELNRLIDFLKHDVRPQIVSLPNLMFIGAAGAIRKRLGVPVVCELTGEDIFLDAMTDSHRKSLRDLIRARVDDVSRFISTTDYYADQMAGYLNIARDRISVVATGLSPEFSRRSRNAILRAPPTVGFLREFARRKASIAWSMRCCCFGRNRASTTCDSASPAISACAIESGSSNCNAALTGRH